MVWVHIVKKGAWFAREQVYYNWVPGSLENRFTITECLVNIMTPLVSFGRLV